MRLRACIVFVVVLVVGACGGHPSAVPAPGAFEKPILLPERVSSPVVEILAELTGMKIGAMALPGLPPMVFDSTADACVIEHEQAHQRQQTRDGDLRWSARYASEFALCWLPERRRDTFARCYHDVSYEREAIAAQAACMLAREPGEKGPI